MAELSQSVSPPLCPDCGTELTKTSGRRVGKPFLWCWKCERAMRLGEARKAGIDADLLREAEQHVVEIAARRGRHSVTSCPPGTRAMCRYADVLRRRNNDA